ncbi:MAG TPA: hypothetical protein VM096_14575 [Vicinamibacterales bacterium]|nr:hypothetical protein [Vicinamibacterales bacterium]
MDTVPGPVGIATEPERRRRKWEAKQLDGTRPLGAWELYRALNDALDEGHDQFDSSNRDARLALILMGGLNAALVIVASQTSLGAGLSIVERQIEAGVIAVYALFAIGFLLQAIDALRPAHYRPKFDRWPKERDDFPVGVRYYEDVVVRDTEAHWQAWRTITLQQLNADLAVQLHSLSLKNQARKLALRGLYRSLRNMAIVFSAILLLFAIFTVI